MVSQSICLTGNSSKKRMNDGCLIQDNAFLFLAINWGIFAALLSMIESSPNVFHRLVRRHFGDGSADGIECEISPANPEYQNFP